MRDEATIEQLLVLSNLENMNAYYIGEGIPQLNRLQRLRSTATDQLQQIAGSRSVRDLSALDGAKEK